MTAVARSDALLAPAPNGERLDRSTGSHRPGPAAGGRPAASVRWELTGCVSFQRRFVGRAAAGLVERVEPAAPLGAVLLSALIVHVALAPHLVVSGAAPDVLLVAVVAVAAGRGPRAGAGFGFAAGLGADLFLATPPGTAALSFTVVGQAIGTLRPLTRPRRQPRPGVPGPAPVGGGSHGDAAVSGGVVGGGSNGDAAACGGVVGGGSDRDAAACGGVVGGGSRGDALPSGGVVRGDPLRRAGGPILSRPSRRRWRAEDRRRLARRAAGLTALGVGAGQLGTAIVATALGGIAFPTGAGLGRIVVSAALSAPFGPLALLLVRRLPGGSAVVRRGRGAV